MKSDAGWPRTLPFRGCSRRHRKDKERRRHGDNNGVAAAILLVSRSSSHRRTALSSRRPYTADSQRLTRPAERAVQAELGFVVADDRPQVLPARLREGLDRLQGFDRQPLYVLDAVEIAVVRGDRRLYPFLCRRDLPLARLHLGVRLNHLAGHAIERGDFAKLGLLDAGLRLATRGPLAEAEITDFPESADDRVEGVVEVLDVAPSSAAESAVPDSEQYAGEQRRAFLAAQTFDSFANELPAFGDLRAVCQAAGHEVGW